MNGSETTNETTNKTTQRRQARRERIKTWTQILGYPSGGLGLFGGTFYLIRQGEIPLAIFTALASVGLIILATVSKPFSDFFESILDKIEEKLEEKVEPLANYIVEALEDYVVKTWWKLTSKFEYRYYQQLIYEYRFYKTLGLKIRGSVRFRFNKIFVPLRVSPESLEQISSHIIATQKKDQNQVKVPFIQQDLGGAQIYPRSEKETTIWDFLVNSKEIEQFKRIAVIGAPGSGKTTLLKDLALTYAQNRHRRQNKKAPNLFPILIYLRDIRNLITTENPTLATVIEKQKSIAELKPRKGLFEEIFTKKNCLVMLDGLDEIADKTERQVVSKWVNQQINKYRKPIFIITSRPKGYESNHLEDITAILEVKPFNLSQMEMFIYNWYLEEEIRSCDTDDQGVRKQAKNQAEDLINRIRNNVNLASFALNPLLLTMIATVHCYRGALPGRRVELYGEICDVLLGKRDKAKGISINLKPEQQKAVLQVLAFRLTAEQETREFNLQLGCDLIENELKNVAGNELTASTFIENIQKRSGLLIERENNLYEFAHKTFQEYLTAVQIKESNQEEILINNLNNSVWWEETIRLYAAQTDTTNLIQSALKNPDVNCLKLALDCCDEGLKVNAQVKENLYQQIETGLESSSNVKEFELAVRVKLQRRLSNLLRVDETLEIDREYITCAEYQLVLNYYQHLHNIKIDEPDDWENGHFPAGNSQKPITGISWKSANMFCAWLYDLKKDNYYRLLRAEEREKYPSKDDSWLANSGIRIARFQLSSRYRILSNLLASQNWQEASEETWKVMLEVANCTGKGFLDKDDCHNFPVSDLHIIDQLWRDYGKSPLCLYQANSHYRLLRQEERLKYPAKDYSWLANNSIRLVRFQLSEHYNDLASLLACQDWKKADQKTSQIMLEVANCTKEGYLEVKDCQNFPVSDLHIIDQLWLDYSQGHFGFSVQKQIYLEEGGTLNKYNSDAWRKLGDRNGWRKNNSWLSYSDLTFNTTAPQGHLPSRRGVREEGKDREYFFSLL